MDAVAGISAARRQQQVGRLDRAEEICRDVLEQAPANAEALFLLASTCQLDGRVQEAIDLYEAALSVRPEHLPTLNNLALALSASGRVEQGERHLRTALEIAPTSIETLNNLGNVLRRLRRPAEAVECFETAIAVKPDVARTHANLALAFADLSRDFDAAASLREAVRFSPKEAELRTRLGVGLLAINRASDALEHLDQAIALDAEHAEAHFVRALALLGLGRLEEGFQEYEWRRRLPASATRDFPQPLWDGSSLEERRILLHAEQGLGDTLQFLRYAKLVKQRGGEVVLQVQRPLIPLLARHPSVDRLVAADEPAPDVDVQAPLMSLPRIVGTRLSTVPADVPYVFADNSLVSKWRRVLSDVNGLRIGIAWRGNPHHLYASERAVPLEEFSAVARLDGVRLVSLQRDGSDELRSHGLPCVVNEALDAEAGPFMDTAAIMMCLDLVLTSDTVIAHLAGALGLPVWVALPFAADARYLLHRDDTPWYPTMRLFRQAEPGDWRGVFERISSALQQRVADRAAGFSIGIDVGGGELIDRIAILGIRARRVSDDALLHGLRQQLRSLQAARDRAGLNSPEIDLLADRLGAVNERLWRELDEVYRCRREGDFGRRFTALTRTVQDLNDERAALKAKIDVIAGSKFTEPKIYGPDPLTGFRRQRG